jgi:DNA-binding beta-propeller fold protein YncE
MKITVLSILILFLCIPLVSDEYNPTTLVVPPFEHTFGYSKITKSSLKMAVGEKISFNNPQGISAVKLRALDDKSTREDDDELTIFAVNSGDHEIFFNKGFKGFGTYGKFGSGEGQLWDPKGICANANGDVYVADSKNDRIVKLFCDGKNLTFVKALGDFGIHPGKFDGPHDVAVDTDGKIYVADTGNDRIQVFTHEGTFLFEFSGSADFHLIKPTAIAVIDKRDRWNFFSSEFIVVVDDNRSRIVHFTKEGEVLGSVSMFSLGMTNAKLEYIAIGYYSNIYVTDENNSQIHIFDRELKFITSFGRKGTGKAEFIQPRGITIWKRYGQVFILGANEAQYYWVGVDAYIKGVFPAIFKEEEPGATISLFITQPAKILVKIFKKDSKELIRELMPPVKREIGEENIVWNGLDQNGELVPPGVYRIEITLRPTYSSKKHFVKKLTCFAERQ